VVYLDHLQFNSGDAFPNGEFENWTMLNDMEPDNWTTLNYITATSSSPYATKTNDSHSGNWAIQIRNTLSFVGETIGYMTNGAFQGYNSIGGLGVNQNPSMVSGYYKYTPIGTDTAQASITSYHWDEENNAPVVLEQQIVNLPPAADYTYFEIPMLYNLTPLVDTINISFAGGLIENGLTPGSKLLLDDIAIEYYPVSVTENASLSDGFMLYPNPAHGNINILNKNTLPFSGTMTLYDNLNREVYSEALDLAPGSRSRIALPALDEGVYFYRLKGIETEQKGKLLVIR